MFATAQPLPLNTGAELVSVDGRTLPLTGTHLTADASAGLCRVVLHQTFENVHAEPLEVHYQVPLPADGAVSGYAFVIGDARIEGRVAPKADAREAFERAVLEGRSAALLEQTRSSLFSQRVGNIPPGQQVRIEIVIDQPLIWQRGGWEWRFPTVVGPRYLGSQTPDPAAVTVPVADGEIAPRLSLSLTIKDARTGAIESPSHLISPDGVRLTGAGARLDRDVVIRWPVAAPTPGVALDIGRGAHDRGYGVLSLVPPVVATEAVPRDLIVLLDTSGSMGGAPLDQAKAITHALIDGLTKRDRLELIEFSTRPRRWKRGAAQATGRLRKKAKDWVSSLSAAGGTEMRTGISAALAPLSADAQRQVIIVTDGLLGFEHQIVAEIRDRLPRGCRVHCVGIGHGVNRSLTRPAAQAGAGVEVIVAPGEPVDAAVKTLLARTGAPQVVDLSVSGTAVLETVPRRLPDLFAQSPARLAVALRPEGGTLVVTGRTARGTWQQRLDVPPIAAQSGNQAAAPLFGRMRVADLELDRDAGEGRSVDPRIEAAGLRYRIATRMTTWIAESVERMVDPTAPSRTEVMPHLLPAGMSAEGVGLRAASGMAKAEVAAGFGGAPPAPSMKRARVRKPVPSFSMRGAPTPAAPPPPPQEPPQEPRFEAAYDADDEFLDEASLATPRLDLPAESPSLPTPNWQGIIAQQSDTRLVVRLPVDHARDWQPGATVTVILATGERRVLTVKADLTTRAGQVQPGQTVRLCLTLAQPLGADITAIELANGEVIAL